MLSLFFSRMQNFLFKCMGVVLNKVTNKDFVQMNLNIMFSSVKHSSQVEREVRMQNANNDLSKDRPLVGNGIELI